MTLTKEDGNGASVVGDGAALMRPGYLEEISTGSQPALTEKPLMRELPTSMPNVAQYAEAQESETVDNVLMEEKSRNDEI